MVVKIKPYDTMGMNVDTKCHCGFNLYELVLRCCVGCDQKLTPKSSRRIHTSRLNSVVELIISVDARIGEIDDYTIFIKNGFTLKCRINIYLRLASWNCNHRPILPLID